VNATITKEADFSTLSELGIGMSGKKKQSSDIMTRALELNALYQHLSKNWNELPQKEKDFYMSLPYQVFNAKPSLFKRIWFIVKLLLTPVDAAVYFREVSWKLLNYLLDKVEEDSQVFQDDLATIINEFDINEAVTVTADNVIEELNRL
jgi:hypothetical protein